MELPQVQEAEVEDEFEDEEMQVPDVALPTEQPAEPASASAPVAPAEPQPAEPANILAPVVPEELQPVETASVLGPVVPEEPQPAEPASVLAPVDLLFRRGFNLLNLQVSWRLLFLKSFNLLFLQPVVPKELAELVVPAAVVPASSAPSEAYRGWLRHVALFMGSAGHRFCFRFKKAPDPNIWKDTYKYPISMSKKLFNVPWRGALANSMLVPGREQEHWKLCDLI